MSFFAGANSLTQPLTVADSLTAWPNMIIGLMCIVAALAFWGLKAWSEYLYGLVLAGHLIIPVWLVVGRIASGQPVSLATFLGLVAIPFLSIVVFADIEYHRRQGILTGGIF